MLMHLAIALVTYNSLVHIARVKPAGRTGTQHAGPGAWSRPPRRTRACEVRVQPETRRRGGNAVFPEPLAAKVPEITFLFWVVKILTTCGGEAVSDYLAAGRQAHRRGGGGRPAGHRPGLAVQDPPLLRGRLLVPGLRDRDLRHRGVGRPAPVRGHPLHGHHDLVGRGARAGLLALVPQRGHAVDPQHHHPAPGDVLLGRSIRHLRARHRPGRLHRHHARPGLPRVGDHVLPHHLDTRRGLVAVRAQLGRRLLVRLRGDPSARRLVRRLLRPAAVAVRAGLRLRPGGGGRGDPRRHRSSATSRSPAATSSGRRSTRLALRRARKWRRGGPRTAVNHDARGT